MNDKLSVIVPVYQVEQYIGECLDSLSLQDYKPIEIIAVDDGTSDDSGCFCDEHAAVDGRFISIHTKNTGVSHARNSGMDLSDGCYITFVDSDDTLIGRPYTALMEVIKDSGADMVSMDYYYSDVVPSNEILSKNFSPESIHSESIHSEGFYEALFDGKMEAVWDKIFKRSAIGNLRFECEKRNEDFLFMVNLGLNPLNIVTTNIVGYFYRKNQNSVTFHFGKNMFDAVKNAEYAYQYCPYAEFKGKAADYLLRKTVMYFINMPYVYLTNGDPDWAYVLQVMKLYSDRSSPALEKKYRVCLKLIKMFPKHAKRYIDNYLKD